MKKTYQTACLVLVVIVFILGISITYKLNAIQITFVVEKEIYETQEIRKNNTFTNLPTPTKEGYAFIGWYDEEGTRLEEKTTPKEDKVYYARWAKIVTEEN